MNAQDLAWNDLQVVLAVCRCGTLSEAARKLGVNHSTVFRRLQGIEERLGVRLFDRLPEGYSATASGDAVHEAAKRIEEEVLALSMNLTGGDLQLRGPIRIASPDAFTLQLLMPILARFQRKYPDIQLEVITDNRFADLTRREADVAIRSTRSPPETAVGRRLGSLAITFYATKRYLKQFPAHDLGAYAYLMPNESFEHFPPSRWIVRHHPEHNVVLRSNTLLVLHEAALLGMGVAPLPCFLADPDKNLQRVIAPHPRFASELWLLTHASLRQTARVRALMDFVAIAFAEIKSQVNGSWLS